MEAPNKYFATPAVNMVNAYHRAMQLVMEEGLEARYKRHERYGKAVRAALAVFGMKALAEECVAAPTLSCILYPEGIDDAAFRKALADKGLVLAGALAALAGKAFRIGHMGNTTPQMLEQAICLIGETLVEMGHKVDVKAAKEKLVSAING
jgi:aspartate aminotransferase-like enzyme